MFAAATCFVVTSAQSVRAEEQAPVMTPGQPQLQVTLPAKQPQTPAVDGASVGSFFSSGAVVNPESMERASIPADQDVNLGPDHKVKAPKPGQQIKKNGFFAGVGRAFAHTANFIGFPVGQDHDVDASLSSNLQNEENQAARNALEAQQAAAAQTAKEKKTSESTTSSQQ